jgi:hypothetical protein
MSIISRIFGYETKTENQSIVKEEYKYENQVENQVEIIKEESDSEGENQTDILGNLIFENAHVKLYVTRAKKFVTTVKVWIGQRPLNRDHVMKLAKEFTKQGHVMGTFKVVRSEDGKIQLLDGQHRVSAINEILKLQPEFNCDLIIELYETDRLESNSTLKLFEKANNVLNVKPEDISHKSALSVVDKLSSQFKLVFKDVEDGKRCIRPYIDKRKLFEKLKKAFEDHDIDEDSLYRQIMERNEYNKKNLQDVADLARSSIDKCKVSGCYLGLEKYWMEEILSIYN